MPARDLATHRPVKLVRQITLVLDEGGKQKVFEVDLCEVGTDQLVVNFRHGQRGKPLQDGSKTIVAVPRAEATRVFDRLVREKTDKGYRDEKELPPARPPGSAPQAHEPAAAPTREAQIESMQQRAQRAAVIERLTELDGDWHLNRVIWRAGELRMREAAPRVIDRIGKGGDLQDYCIAWALGRCGDTKSVSALGTLQTDPRRSPAVRRIAAEALRQVAGGTARAAIVQQALDTIPANPRPPIEGSPSADPRPSLRSLAQNGPAAAFAAAFDELILGGAPGDLALIESLYLIDNEHVRTTVLRLARAWALEPPFFRHLRHLFKAAEYREDAELFGLLAHRFELSPSKYRSREGFITVNGKWLRLKDESAKPDTTIAFSSATRDYMRRRVWRTLRRMGERGDEGFVKMAVGVLLPFTDADAGRVRSASYGWGTSAHEVQWDTLARYFALNHILYENSPRYQCLRPALIWRCKDGYKVGDPAPATREEAFPELWNKVPVGLLHLLADSRCGAVHEFAARALRDNAAFCASLDLEVVILLLEKPYEVTARLGFDLGKGRYDPAAPHLGLLTALATCAVEEARRMAHRWIDEGRHTFAAEAELVARLAFSRYADARQCARLLLCTATIAGPARQALIVRLIARLLGLAAGGEESAAMARDVGDTMLRAFAPELRTLGLEVVNDLLAHPLREVQDFGAQILLAHATRPQDLPEDLLAAVMNAPFESVRGMGMRLFGELPDATLIERQQLLVALTVSALADVRDAVRPVIRRLAGAHPDFASDLSVLLIAHLLRKERHEGVHSALLRLLKEDLVAALSFVPKATVQRLLKAKSSAAQELGGILLPSIGAADLEIAEIARFASHEILSVRRAAWKLYEDNVPRLKADMTAAVRILDAKWDDSRAFAFTFFREHFSGDDFTPTVLVGVCDSVREDVQRFGRDLVTRYFQEEAGQEYLLKLSEHPSVNLQLFTTNYLARYAAGNVDRLRELEPFFVGVLSRVNKARVAKRRIIDFLRAEAVKSEDAAQIVARILGRQSATIAIGDKAATIEAMLTIREAYPAVELPLVVKPVAVRAGGAA